MNNMFQTPKQPNRMRDYSCIVNRSYSKRGTINRPIRTVEKG